MSLLSLPLPFSLCIMSSMTPWSWKTLNFAVLCLFFCWPLSIQTRSQKHPSYNDTKISGLSTAFSYDTDRWALAFSPCWVTTLHCREQWSAWRVSMTTSMQLSQEDPGWMFQIYGHKVLSKLTPDVKSKQNIVPRLQTSHVSAVYQENQVIPTL